MKKFLLIASLLFMAFVYLSWRKPGGPGHGSAASAAATAHSATPAAFNVPALAAAITNATRPSPLAAALAAPAPPAPTGNGQPVTRAQYQPCLDSFVAVMGRYGITPNNPPVKNTSCPAMTWPITTSESFQASGFIAWLQSIVDTYDPSGKGANLDFQIKFGICTPKFVADLGQNTALVGRIAVFVVGAYRDTPAAKALKAKALKSAAGTDPGGTGYELGGLQP